MDITLLSNAGGIYLFTHTSGFLIVLLTVASDSDCIIFEHQEVFMKVLKHIVIQLFLTLYWRKCFIMLHLAWLTGYCSASMWLCFSTLFQWFILLFNQHHTLPIYLASLLCIILPSPFLRQGLVMWPWLVLNHLSSLHSPLGFAPIMCTIICNCGTVVYFWFVCVRLLSLIWHCLSYVFFVALWIKPVVREC